MKLHILALALASTTMLSSPVLAEETRVMAGIEAALDGKFKKQLTIDATSSPGSNVHDQAVGINLQSDNYNGVEMHAGPSVGSDGLDLTVGGSYGDDDTSVSISAGVSSENGLGASFGGIHDLVETKEGGAAIGAGVEISNNGFDIGPNVEVFGENLGLRVSTTDVRVIERDPETNERRRYSVNPISLVINELFGVRSALDVIVCGGDTDCNGVPLGVFSFITDFFKSLLTEDKVAGQEFKLPEGFSFDKERSVLVAPNGIEIQVLINKLDTTMEIAHMADPTTSSWADGVDRNVQLSLLVFEDGSALNMSGKALSEGVVAALLYNHDRMNDKPLVIIKPLTPKRTITIDQEINPGKIRIEEKGVTGAPVSVERAEYLIKELH